MTESQKIAELRNLLAQLDQPKQVSEVAPLVPAAIAGARMAAPYIARGASNLGSRVKHMGRAVEVPKTALPATAANAARTASTAAKPGMSTAGKLATAANIGAAGYSLSQIGGGQSPAPAEPAKPATGQSGKPTAASTSSALTPQEEGEMGVLSQELEAFMGQDPALDALLLQYEKMRPGASSAQP